MDLELIRSIVTVAAFASFLGIAAWAWSARREQQFAEAARLPFDEGELEPAETAAATVTGDAGKR